MDLIACDLQPIFSVINFLKSKSITFAVSRKHSSISQTTNRLNNVADVSSSSKLGYKL